jgi:hypothetical protein
VVLRYESVSFLAQFDEGCEGSFAFSGFLTFAMAAGEFDAIVMDGAFKEAVVIGASGGDNVVLGRLGRDRLKQFLEFAFGIFECRNDRQRADRAMKLAQNEFTGGIKTAIEKNGAEEGFESIR